MQVPRHIFRDNDVRGIYGTELTPEIAFKVGAALGAEARAGEEVIIGHDMRTSSPTLASSLASGLMASGTNVTMLGLATTPLVYFATTHKRSRLGVMVTASHLPLDHNGFKIARGGLAYTYEKLIGRLEKRVFLQDYRKAEWNRLGSMKFNDGMVKEYVDYLASRVDLERRLKVVVDVGSGSCWFAAQVFSQAGLDTKVLNPTPSGLQDSPRVDPLKPETLARLRQAVIEERADMGVALDPDADRVGFVDDRGTIMLPDHVAILLAKSVRQRVTKPKILLYVGLASPVIEYVKQMGADVEAIRPGHSYIQEHMVRTGAVMAAEANGHYYVAENFYGFDDGLHVALRLAEGISHSQQKLSEVVHRLPRLHIIPTEIHIPVPEKLKNLLMERLLAKVQRSKHKVVTLYGVKAESDSWWFLARKSSSEPSLVLRYGGNSKRAAEDARRYLENLLNDVMRESGLHGMVNIPPL